MIINYSTLQLIILLYMEFQSYIKLSFYHYLNSNLIRSIIKNLSYLMFLIIHYLLLVSFIKISKKKNSIIFIVPILTKIYFKANKWRMFNLCQYLILKITMTKLQILHLIKFKMVFKKEILEKKIKKREDIEEMERSGLISLSKKKALKIHHLKIKRKKRKKREKMKISVV